MSVTVDVDEENVTVNVDGKPVIGIDLSTGTIGHWPDGEEWVPVAQLDQLATFDDESEEYDHSRAKEDRRNAYLAEFEREELGQ